MALRLNPSANYLTLASAPSAPYTVVVNARFLADDYFCPVVFGDAEFGLAGGFNRLYINTSGGDVLGSTTINLNQWYKFIWTWDGTTDQIYINNNLEISTTSYASRAFISLGRPLYTPNTEAIALDGLKIWSALLSASERDREIQSIKPVRQANLWAWLPNNTNGTQGREYGGNNRHFTVNGAPVDVAAAPVPWGGGVDIFPASSAPPVTDFASPLMLLAC